MLWPRLASAYVISRFQMWWLGEPIPAKNKMFAQSATLIDDNNVCSANNSNHGPANHFDLNMIFASFWDRRWRNTDFYSERFMFYDAIHSNMKHKLRKACCPIQRTRWSANHVVPKLKSKILTSPRLSVSYVLIRACRFFRSKQIIHKSVAQSNLIRSTHEPCTNFEPWTKADREIAEKRKQYFGILVLKSHSNGVRYRPTIFFSVVHLLTCEIRPTLERLLNRTHCVWGIRCNSIRRGFAVGW